jgi:hypothetical protein
MDDDQPLDALTGLLNRSGVRPPSRSWRRRRRWPWPSSTSTTARGSTTSSVTPWAMRSWCGSPRPSPRASRPTPSRAAGGATRHWWCCPSARPRAPSSCSRRSEPSSLARGAQGRSPHHHLRRGRGTALTRIDVRRAAASGRPGHVPGQGRRQGPGGDVRRQEDGDEVELLRAGRPLPRGQAVGQHRPHRGQPAARGPRRRRPLPPGEPTAGGLRHGRCPGGVRW